MECRDAVKEDVELSKLRELCEAAGANTSFSSSLSLLRAASFSILFVLLCFSLRPLCLALLRLCLPSSCSLLLGSGEHGAEGVWGGAGVPGQMVNETLELMFTEVTSPPRTRREADRE